MGHLHDTKGAYYELRKRADRTQSGLPETPEIYDILRHLFTEEQAAIAARLPVVPRSLRSIARRYTMPSAELRKHLDQMADKGLVFDFHHPTKGEYFMLAPPVVGFLEFSMMRVRTDIDQKALAKLLGTYLYERPDFVAEISRGGTPIGRTLLHESAMPPEITSDVLDHERATRMLSEASSIAASLCYCRHKKEHLGEACGKPVDVCLSINKGAEFVIRRGHGRNVEKAEALDILQRVQAEGLVQIADNVRNQPTYLCNCCGCCCGQLVAINRHGLLHAVSTSGFRAAIDQEKCTGCGRCSRACPVRAIAVRARPFHHKSPKRATMMAEVDHEICLGCGVCKPSCKQGAVKMERSPQRVLTPESTLERVIRMAVGRGHLHDLLFDEHDGPTAAFANRLVGAIENLPWTQRALLNETLRSRFVGFLARAATHDTRTPKEVSGN